MNPKLDMDNPASGIQLRPEGLKNSVVQSLLSYGLPVTRETYLKQGRAGGAAAAGGGGVPAT